MLMGAEAGSAPVAGPAVEFGLGVDLVLSREEAGECCG